MTTPCILLASCADFNIESLIKGILQTEVLPERKKLIESIDGFDWHISTKYYTADVLLCTTKGRTIGDQGFAESVDAFIAYFDSNQESSFELVKAWTPYLEQIEPEVKMLVCDRCTEKHKVNRLATQTWCVDNGFELVELNPEVESDSDVEDDFVETTGVKRIVQALHAHTWSNLKMKDNPVHHSPYLRQLMQEEYESKQLQTSTENPIANSETDDKIDHEIKHSNNFENHSKSDSDNGTANSAVKADIVNVVTPSVSDVKAEIVKDLSEESSGSDNHSRKDSASCVDCTGDASESGANTDIPKSSEKKPKVKEVKQPAKEGLDNLLQASDMALFECLGDEDPGGESFEKLFERFGRMKERASNLPPEERKKYAEQVAVAFWQAIGGDEDEIANLSDSD